MYENFSLNGQIVDGRVVLDPFVAEQSTPNSDETGGCDSEFIVDANGSFVAVNAPFDPESVELEAVEA